MKGGISNVARVRCPESRFLSFFFFRLPLFEACMGPICGVFCIDLYARGRLVLILQCLISVHKPHSPEGQPIAQRGQIVDAGTFRVFFCSIMMGKFWLRSISKSLTRRTQKCHPRPNWVIIQGVINDFVQS